MKRSLIVFGNLIKIDIFVEIVRPSISIRCTVETVFYFIYVIVRFNSQHCQLLAVFDHSLIHLFILLQSVFTKCLLGA